jgi:predicted nucleotidyltransferase
LNQRISNEISLWVEEIIRVIPVEKIFLFGSQADGTAKSDSDLDIFVVADDSVSDCLNASIKIRKAAYSRQTMPADLIISNSNAFNKRKNLPTLEHRIATEGQLIYG